MTLNDFAIQNCRLWISSQTKTSALTDLSEYPSATVFQHPRVGALPEMRSVRRPSVRPSVRLCPSSAQSSILRVVAIAFGDWRYYSLRHVSRLSKNRVNSHARFLCFEAEFPIPPLKMKCVLLNAHTFTFPISQCYIPFQARLNHPRDYTDCSYSSTEM